MKQKFNFMLLLFMITAGNSWAQGNIVTNANAGFSFTITSTQNASAVNAIRYQWYRNGVPIGGATGASYTVPAAYAYGDNVRFQRMATTTECAGTSEAYSNSVTISFTGAPIPVGCNLFIGGVCWADRNVAAFGSFAPKPDQQTVFYQWGKTTAYSYTDPITPAWDAAINNAMAWDHSWDPCPQGWRMPTETDAQLLTTVGSTWVPANTRGASVPGRFLGYNHTICTLPNNMQGCIFLPTAGYRHASNGVLTRPITDVSPYSTYWTTTAVTTTTAIEYLMDGSTIRTQPANKAYAFPIRCVQ